MIWVIGYLVIATASLLLAAYIEPRRHEEYIATQMRRWPSLGRKYHENDAVYGLERGSRLLIAFLCWPVALPLHGLSVAVKRLEGVGTRAMLAAQQEQADAKAREDEINRIIRESAL